MKLVKKSIELGGRELSLSSGRLAGQADGAVLAQYGETVVLATVVSSPLFEDRGYFPLSVEYQERLYAGGRIKGSRWIKREGRPSDEEILTGRLIDRSIRPLFYEDYKRDVQVVVTVLSIDLESDPTFVAAVAVSAAIECSPIPWMGPVGVVTVGIKDDAYFVNPRESEIPFSDLELVVASTKKAVVMIEAGAKEVEEEKVLGGIEFAQKEAEGLIKFVEEFAKEAGVKKEAYKKNEQTLELSKQVKKLVTDKIALAELVRKIAVKEMSGEEVEELKRSVVEAIGEVDRMAVGAIFDKLVKKEAREMVLSGKRADGRKLDEIREIYCEVGVLPRTHGSAIFQRGTTQALTVTTLGSPSLGQLIESAGGEEEKRYIHHYSMPPFSTGETGRMGSPSRREIGHGALAERALLPVIPAESLFPYTIRVVSEVLSSNGSTSMASTCGSTLSLMDSGVPITSPVSGIAMGLVVESEKKYAVLSDIAGFEDFNGDMDFKVAGTSKGITAMQMDVKTLGLTLPILKDALERAKKGRAEILEKMLKTLPEAREKVSTYAPKVRSVKIDADKIGEVIGPGGRMIKRIIADTGADVEVEDDGTVNVSGMNSESVDRAVSWVESITKEVKIGELYHGEVKRIQPFGVFVELLPGKEGLVRIADMSEEFVRDPGDVVKLGQEVDVRVKEIDSMGRINLTMILDPGKAEMKKQRVVRRETTGRRDRGSDVRGGDNDKVGTGPHFPASRYVDTRRRGRFGR